ncbi:unnamed protein product [Leuciscus chuanchicus]
MADNNLLVAASILFTGATYVDIADWAACLNVQIPKKTSFYAIQSSYLIPVVDVFYKEQQAKLLEDYLKVQICQGMEDLIGSLEVYHSVLLKYCPKILHFHYSSMADRTQLVILDHNENVNREQATTPSGKYTA